jgi:outer membrane protein assembly factor BamB
MKRMVILFLFCIALSAPVGVVHSEDWRGFRGTTGSGVSTEKGLPLKWDKKEGIAWKMELPGRGLSSPVVAKGRVFVTCSSGYRENRLHVLCFDAQTGKKLWERQFTSTGSTSCHPKTCMAAPTPVSDGDNVYCLFATGDLAALDRDGVLLWYRSMVGDYPNITNQVGMAASPALSGTTLLLPLENVGDSFAAAIDTRTGRNIWKEQRKRDVNWVTPVVVAEGNRPYAIFQTKSEATAYDVATGKVRWTLNPGEELSGIPSPTAAEGVVLIPGPQSVVLRPPADGRTPDQLWRAGKLTGGYPSPLIYQGKVYGLNTVGLNCLSLKDGSQLWQQRLPGPFAASPIIADGKAYLVNEKGVTTVLSLGVKPEIVAKNELDDTILCTPAVSGGAIYVRSDKWLYRIGKAAK